MIVALGLVRLTAVAPIHDLRAIKLRSIHTVPLSADHALANPSVGFERPSEIAHQHETTAYLPGLLGVTPCTRLHTSTAFRTLRVF